jgi:hypothetical protein
LSPQKIKTKIHTKYKAMTVSSGLQKYFDSQQKKKSKGDMKKKFQDLA